jgi:hypothetical protein
MDRKIPWAEVIVAAFVIAAGAAVYLYAHRDDAALEASRERGARIVQALVAYREEHDTYPDELDSLSPQYLQSVEPPLWGLERWRYRTYTPEGVGGASDTSAVYFQLSVAADESGYPVLYYDFATGRWVLNN